MYRSENAGKGCEARASGGKDRDRDGGQSVVIVDVSVSSSSPERVLVAKQERLERAAKLLGKDGGREGNG